MRPLVCLLIAIPLLAPAQTPEPTIRTTTNEVLLDFVVRDKHANIIRDLKPEEVQIFEDGVPQKPRYFQFINGHTTAQPSPEPVPTSPSTAAAPGAIAPATPITINELRDMSVVSVVISNLDPRDRALTADAMRAFVRNELTPNTYVGVFRMDMGGLHLLQSYTNDGEKISAAVVEAATSARTGQYQGIGLQSALGSTGSVGPSAMPTSMSDLHWANALQDAYQSSIGTIVPLHELVAAQATIPGRKVVLLFMSGLQGSPDTVEALRSVISAANRANVTIYAYNGGVGYGSNNGGRRAIQAAANASMQQQLAKATGGDMTVTPTEAVALDLADYSIVANSTGNLSDLAEATGGALLRPSNNMIEPLHEAMEGLRTHYELTYAPTNAMIDGSFRKIEVKVTRPGATVFARSGYYSLPTLNGQQIYPFEIATLKAINTRPDLHQFNFHATTLEFRPGALRNQFAFLFQAPTRDLTVTTDQQWAKVHVCVTALIRDDKGEVVDKISKDIPYEVPSARKAELEQGTVSFTAPFFLPPGHYTVDTASVDRQSMKASVNRSALDVEQDSGFAMSGVTIVRRVDDVQGPANAFDPLQARGGEVTPDLSDQVTPDASGTLKFYAVAYPPAPVDAPIAMKIEIWQDEKLVMRSGLSQVPLDASGAASVLASVPSAKLPSGHYEAHVSFQYKEEKLTKEVKFTLAGAS